MISHRGHNAVAGPQSAEGGSDRTMHTLIRTGAARRVGSLIIGVVLIVVVTIVAFGRDGQGNGGQAGNGQTGNGQTNDGQSAKCDLARPLTEVRGLIGSEKEGFFNDERVRREF